MAKILAVTVGIALALAGCGGGGSSAEPSPGAGDTSGETKGLTYVALGDSWPEGAHCNGCRTFPQTHAEALSELLGKPVTLRNLSGEAQPYFESSRGGGSTGLRKALERDEAFRDEVAAGDIIVISTGPNDLERIGTAIEQGECGGSHDTACVAVLDRTWHDDFDTILAEIEELRAGKPTAIRLVTAANAFNNPSFSEATLRGWDAAYAALTQAMCDNAAKHDAVCVDVRPVLNGPDFEQPVNDSSQASMDAVAELLVETGAPELE